MLATVTEAVTRVQTMSQEGMIQMYDCLAEIKA